MERIERIDRRDKRKCTTRSYAQWQGIEIKQEINKNGQHMQTPVVITRGTEITHLTEHQT